MTEAVPSACELRVIVLAPTSRDAALTQSVFEQAGIACMNCFDLESVCVELDRGAAALLLAEEVVVQDHQDCLAAWLQRQPPWSDLAVLVLARPGADSAAVARAMDVLGNVTVLERPTRVAALVSAAKSSIRARLRQYQIREHLAERERAAESLREDDRRKDEFLAILAHELRNPLAPIRNSLHVLRLRKLGDETIEGLADVMERQVEHLVRLVDDLLEISRITRGKIELCTEPLKIADVLRHAIEASRPLIDASRHELSVRVPDVPVVVDGDPIRLAQVFANLLNNAAKYTDPPGRIALSVVPEGATVVISVRDSGVGIPRHMLHRVFDLFTQADHGQSRAQGGLGIGLTLVKRLVEMHGGTVEARSEGPGHGSEFVVTLPLCTEAVCSGGDASARDARVLAPRRVLVVDDNHDAADSLGVLLRVLGADAHVVYDGEAALRSIAELHPAVVLLDVGMPGMDGHEVARRVRKQREYDDVMLIALTGWGKEEDRRRTLAAGFDHHLIKPADVHTLSALLCSLEGA